MSFPSSPINGQTTQLNGITYIYNATNNAWRRQNLTDITVSGTVTASNVQVNSGITFNDNSRLTSGLVYDLNPMTGDGLSQVYTLRFNQDTVTVTNPWNLLVTINGLFQPAFIENDEYVWQSYALCAYSGYTVTNGNLKFAEAPAPGSVIRVRTQPGSAQSAQQIYPFKPIDIVLGL
jgi:hypothetical protein